MYKVIYGVPSKNKDTKTETKTLYEDDNQRYYRELNDQNLIIYLNNYLMLIFCT